MAEPGILAAEYAAARPRLERVAYAILGSRAEAEDVVAECWLRVEAADRREPVEDVVAFATVAVARAAVDVLRSARARRETYVGPWLPEPEVSESAPADPAERVTLDDSVRYALLVVLEQLTPAERTAWVLHDLFGLPFEQVAQAVGRSPAAVRQLARRARQHVADGAPRLSVDPREHERVVGAFSAAVDGGDLAALLRTLDPSVVLTADGGGEVGAARRPVLGADRVARFLLGIARKNPGAVVPIAVNGAAGLGVLDAAGGRLRADVALTVEGERVVRVDIVLAPDKLRA